MIRILEKVQNKIPWPVLKKYFSRFCTTASEFHSKVCKTYKWDQQKIFLKKQYFYQSTEFYADFRSVKSVTQKACEKVMSKIVS